MNDETGEPGDYIPPNIIVLTPTQGLPSNGKLVMQVVTFQGRPAEFELDSISVSLPVGDDLIDGEVTIDGNLAWWTPNRQLPLGPHPLSITAVDFNGGRYSIGDILAHIPGDSFNSHFPGRIVVVEPDTTSPVLMSTQPSQGSLGVPLEPTVEFNFTFSESVLTHNANISLEPPFEDSLYLTSVINPNSREPLAVIRLLIEPGSKLSLGTRYTLRIEGIEDLAGNKVVPVKLEFTTDTIGLQ